MLEAFFRWIARRLAGILERYADPDLDAKLRTFNEKVAAQDAKIKEAENAALLSEAAYHESVERRRLVDQQLADSLALETESRIRLKASQDRVKEIEAELATTQAIIDRQSDRDSVRADI